MVSHRVEPLDSIFVALSNVGRLGLVWILAGAVLALARRRLWDFVLVAGAVVVSDVLVTGLKFAFGRPRPYLRFPDPEPIVGAALDLGLPSGHAATSFAGALMLSLLAPRLAVSLFPLAAAIAWSRVYAGVHWPSDIVLGAILGLAVATALWLTAPRMLAAARRRPPPPPRPG